MLNALSWAARRIVLCSILVSAASAGAAVVYRDKAAYLAAVGSAGVASFEDIATGQTPVVSGGIRFTAAQVAENVFGHPYEAFFQDLGSPTHYVVMTGDETYPLFGFKATLPVDAFASGFIFNCMGCDGGDSAFDWATLDASDNVVEQGTIVVTFPNIFYPPANFLGVHSTMPFRALRVTRRGISQPLSLNWVADDIRYSVGPPAVTVLPAVPASGPPVLLLITIALGFSGWIALRSAGLMAAGQRRSKIARPAHRR